MSKSDSLLKASAITLVANLANRGLGFVRESSLARLFGTGILLDRFVVAFALPEYLAFVVFASLPIALLPTRQEVGNDPGRVSAFFWSSLGWITAVYALLGIGILVWASPLLTLFGIKAEPETVRITQLLSCYPLINALEAYFRGWLYDARSFTTPALSSLALNLVFIIGLWFMPEGNPLQLAQLYVAASMVSMLWNGVGVFRVHSFPAFSLRSTFAKILIVRQWQIGVVEGIALSYPLIDRFIASRWLGDGEVAALRYAFLLVMLPSAILSYTASTSAYPWVTAKSTPEKVAELRTLYHNGVRMILLLVSLVAAGLFLFAEDCVAIAFQRGSFDAVSLALTTQPVKWFALGLPCYAVVLYQMRFFYARTAIWLLGGLLLIMTLLKITGSYLLTSPTLTYQLGTSGLAIATTVVWVVTFFVLGSKVNRWTESSWRELLWTEGLKILVVTAVAAAIWLVGKQLWPLSDPTLTDLAIRLGVLGLGGVSAYLLVGKIINLNVQRQLFGKLFRKGG